MRSTVAVPSGIERTFGIDDVIVTKTDLKGRITYANDVFLSISAYAEADALGQPHNLVRHPDMPRCVFKLLWDTLEHRDEVSVYVINLASDGAFYWVLAHVNPSIGAGGRVVGYHSTRRVAGRAAISQVQPLYAQLRASESRHARPADAIAASTEQLGQFLADRDQTWDEFVWSLARESASR